MSSVFIALPIESGGAPGAVDSFNGRTGIVVPQAGDYNADQITFVPAGTIAATDVQAAIEEVAAEAQPVIAVGNQAVLGTDLSGVVVAIPNRVWNADNRGIDSFHPVDVVNDGAHQLNNINAALNPTEDSPTSNWSINNIYAEIDSADNGFVFGDVTARTATLSAQSTGNIGRVAFISNYADIGNGTDAIEANGLIFNYGFADINENVTLTSSIQGYGFQPHVHINVVASTINAMAFFDGANYESTMAGVDSFSAFPQIAEIATNNNYTGLVISPTITNLAGTAGMLGVQVVPNIGTMDSGSLTAVNIDPNVTNAGTATITGINISMGNVSGMANANGPTALNISNGRFNMNSPTLSDSAAFSAYNTLSTDNYTPAGGGAPFGTNQLGGEFRVAAGFPITGGAFGIGNNLGHSMLIEDNFPPDGSGLGLGYMMNGFVTTVAVTAGNTLDSLNFMAAAASVNVLSTGGNITDVSMFRALGIVPGGGSMNITNIYGFKVDSLLSAMSPTNAWGVYVADTNANNWFAKNVVIGGATALPTGAFALDVTGNAHVDGALTVSTGANGTFTTADAKTVTVVGGIITSITP